MITILNTSIITTHGEYKYEPISLDTAKEMVQNNPFQSAIGHDSTSQIISTLLGVNCPVNRILYKQQIGELALVFKLNGRPSEGKILTVDELEAIGYEWGLLTKTA